MKIFIYHEWLREKEKCKLINSKQYTHNKQYVQLTSYKNGGQYYLNYSTGYSVIGLNFLDVSVTAIQGITQQKITLTFFD